MTSNSSLGIVLAASEAVGFAKTGGLADVAGALPRAVAALGHRTAIILPLYGIIRRGKVPITPTDTLLAIPIGGRVIPSRLYRAFLPDSSVPVFLVENAEYFERDTPGSGNGLYHLTLFSGQRRDYPDNCERYIFFSRAVMEALPYVGFPVDILHANDWQTGLLPVYLKELYRGRPGYKQLRTLFTVHNLSYQGLFRASEFPLTGLDGRLFTSRYLEYYGQLNLLKGGLLFADWINTVSPTYAQEIQTPYFGCGLEGVVSERKDRVSGIVNGIDPDVWNPATDPYLPARYDVATHAVGKAACKRQLQESFQLPQNANLPVIGMVARLVEQKGIDLVIRTFESLMQMPIQLIILGEGDPAYHKILDGLREQFPNQFGLLIGFDEGLAHVIEAGSDLFLMPSLYEPSGLNQLYSLRYGTIPIVRATGGLADTITDTTDETIRNGTATGFRFGPFGPEFFLSAVQRAVDYYFRRPDIFRRLITTAMTQDWSWRRSAQAYVRLYRRLLAERDGLPITTWDAEPAA